MPDPSPSNADSLNSNFLQLGRSGGRPPRAVHPVRLPVNTVIHTTLVGLEPATFRGTQTTQIFHTCDLYATAVIKFWDETINAYLGTKFGMVMYRDKRRIEF